MNRPRGHAVHPDRLQLEREITSQANCDTLVSVMDEFDIRFICLGANLANINGNELKGGNRVYRHVCGFPGSPCSKDDWSISEDCGAAVVDLFEQRRKDSLPTSPDTEIASISTETTVIARIRICSFKRVRVRSSLRAPSNLCIRDQRL